MDLEYSLAKLKQNQAALAMLLQQAVERGYPRSLYDDIPGIQLTGVLIQMDRSGTWQVLPSDSVGQDGTMLVDISTPSTDIAKPNTVSVKPSAFQFQEF